MAFIGMVFAFLFLCLCAVGFVGLILLIVGIVIKVRNKKRAKKSKAPIVLIILGIVFLLPITLIVTASIVGGISTGIKNKGNFDYQVKYGTVENVERLLKKGVSPECERDNFQENVVAEDGEYTELFYLCYSDEVPNYAEKMKLLIDYGADVNRTVHWCDYTMEEHLGDKYDKDRGNNDGCGDTPLMIACRSGSYDAVKVLIENGADVNAKDYCGETALIYATKPSGYSTSGDVQIKIVNLLLKNGADKNAKGKYSRTALDEAHRRDCQEMVNILTQ